MAGISREEFDQAAREIQAAWSNAQSRDAGFQVILDQGRKYGYKNVVAAIQGRIPKQFERETTVSEFIDKANKEESTRS
ncbi:MAG: hypothetical protein ACRDFX_07285 [Chloroflexota bacterium]